MLLGYVNSICISDGGIYMDGFKFVIICIFNVFGRKFKIIKEKDENFNGEYV